MVDIIPFDSLTMAESVKSWLKLRDLDSDLVDDYPENTWMAMHGHQFVASAAVIITNGMALLVGLTTNPFIDSEIRHVSIDALVKTIIKKSKELGAKNLLAWTKDDGVLKRSFEHGFKIIPQTMIGLDLKGE